MEFNSAWVGVVGLLVAGFGAWVKMIERLTSVETRQRMDSERFDQIMSHLTRIEEKLDRKVDK